MRLIQPIFAGPRTKDTGLGEDNKILMLGKKLTKELRKI